MKTPPRSSASEADFRSQRVARLLASGARRSDCVQFAAKEWGVGIRTADSYIARARKLLREDWTEVKRDQMLAEILSQYSSLQMEARRQGQLAVALGCIHGAAKVAQLTQ
jgi:hypothetical protein